MAGRRKREKESGRMEVIGVCVEEALAARIRRLQVDQELTPSLSSLGRHLFIKGLEAIEKEAARG